jgi:hypothetical protein
VDNVDLEAGELSTGEARKRPEKILMTEAREAASFGPWTMTCFPVMLLTGSAPCQE